MWFPFYHCCYCLRFKKKEICSSKSLSLLFHSLVPTILAPSTEEVKNCISVWVFQRLHTVGTLDIWKHIHWFNCNLLHFNQLMHLKLKVLHHRLVHLSEWNVQSQSFSSKRKTDHFFFLMGLTSKLWKLVNTLNLIYCFFPKNLCVCLSELFGSPVQHTQSPLFVSSHPSLLLSFLHLSLSLSLPPARIPTAARTRCVPPQHTHTDTHTPIHPPTDAAGNA